MNLKKPFNLKIASYHWILIYGIKTHNSNMEINDRRLSIFLWRSHFIVQFRIFRQQIEELQTPPEISGRNFKKVQTFC